MKPVVVDVREPFEFARSHVDGAINIPPADLLAGAQALRDVPKDAEIILYCLSGSRSGVAINILRSLGYTKLVNGINQGHVEARLRRQ